MSDDDILAALDAELADVAEPEVTNLQDLSDVALGARRKIMTDRLVELGEVIHPRSKEALHLHAELDLIRFELNRRRHAR